MRSCIVSYLDASEKQEQQLISKQDATVFLPLRKQLNSIQILKKRIIEIRKSKENNECRSQRFKKCQRFKYLFVMKLILLLPFVQSFSYSQDISLGQISISELIKVAKMDRKVLKLHQKMDTVTIIK